ncbi:hypothetical protein D3C78_1312040 [compost metagenome]
MFQEGKHLIAEIFQAQGAILRAVFCGEIRQHFGQRGVGVIMTFKGQQRFQQGTPFPFGHPHREQEHQLEVGGAGWHNAVAG